jgi:hypothetical protein
MLYANDGKGTRTFTEVGIENGVQKSDWAWGSVFFECAVSYAFVVPLVRESDLLLLSCRSYDLDEDLDLACTVGYTMYETGSNI